MQMRPIKKKETDRNICGNIAIELLLFDSN